MPNLDSPQQIKRLDKKNLASTIEQLGKQCDQVYRDISALKFDPKFSGAQKIVVCGMGGSTLGTDIIRSLFFDRLKVQLEIVNGYHIPASVDSKTLVILSSYSGTTEEVLSAYKEAKATGAMIMAIASGGELGRLVVSGEVSGYVFEPKHNPSGQPRMGLGYSILSQVVILSKLGFLEFAEQNFKEILTIIDKVNAACNPEVKVNKNRAKQLASQFLEKIPALFASEHLIGNIHTFANQLNENAKVFSAYFTLPEADHHLIEGFPSYKEARQELVFFFLKSSLYSPRVLSRYDVTADLAKKAGYEVLFYELDSESKLSQSFEFLTFGSWVSFYLAVLYNRDPSPIPNVDYLKSKMAETSKI